MGIKTIITGDICMWSAFMSLKFSKMKWQEPLSSITVTIFVFVKKHLCVYVCVHAKRTDPEGTPEEGKCVYHIAASYVTFQR